MSDVNWQAIRTEYENGSSLRALAAKYGVSKSAIGERKYKEQWTQPINERTLQNKQPVINRDVNAASRATLAIKLRAGKMTFEQIAHKCGYASPGACRNAILRELQRVVVTNVEELRREELYILDTLHGEAWTMAMDTDNSYRTFAMDRVLAISKARRELMGLDASKDSNLMSNVVVVREVPSNYLGQAVEAPTQ